MEPNSGFAVGGLARLRKAIEEEVRREFHEKLPPNSDDRFSVGDEERIEEEVNRRLSETTSEQSLWAE